MSWSFQNNIYLILLFFGPNNFEAFCVKDPEAPLMIITTSELTKYETLGKVWNLVLWICHVLLITLCWCFVPPPTLSSCSPRALLLVSFLLMGRFRGAGGSHHTPVSHHSSSSSPLAEKQGFVSHWSPGAGKQRSDSNFPVVRWFVFTPRVAASSSSLVPLAQKPACSASGTTPPPPPHLSHPLN